MGKVGPVDLNLLGPDPAGHDFL